MDAPTGLSIFGFTATQVQLTWDAVPSATSYPLEFKQASEPSWSPYSSPATESETVIGLIPNTEYNFQVAASDGVDQSTFSDPITQLTLPDAPTGASHTSPSPTSLSLTWVAPATGADSYDVYEEGIGFIANTSNTDYLATGFSSNTYHQFLIHARNSAGYGEPVTVGGTTMDGVPQMPESLISMGISPNEIEISWVGPVMGWPPDSYNIYRDGNFVTNTSVSPYLDSGLANNTNYTHAVESVNTYGTSAQSTVGGATANGTPDAPSIMTATQNGTTEIDIAWNDPGGPYPPTSYDIWRDDFFLTNVTGFLSYFDTGLPPGTQHTYRVYSVNSYATSPDYVSDSAWTLPLAPTGVTISGYTSANANLFWTGVTCNGYNIYASTDGGLGWILVLGNVVGMTEAQVSLNAGTTYMLGVRAFNGDNEEGELGQSSSFTTWIQITGTHYDREAWPTNNWDRMTIAHGAIAGRPNLFHGTLDIQINNLNGSSATEWVPPDDDAHRMASHMATGGDRSYENGNDFLYQGNYVHPAVVVRTVNGIPLSVPGLLYYAGSPDSFSAPGEPGLITRHSLEIMADDVLIGSVGVGGTAVIEIAPV